MFLAFGAEHGIAVLVFATVWDNEEFTFSESVEVERKVSW
jgi:hypothetical protein